MKHIDEGALLTLADGEMDEVEAARLTRHLDACAACRQELGTIRDAAMVFSTALQESDAPIPVVSETTARAMRRSTSPRRSWGRRDLGRAAVLIIGFAAAASATLPGSPVNSWIREMRQPVPQAVVESVSLPSPQASGDEMPAFVADAGVSVMPHGGVVHVVLRGATPDLRLKAVLVDLPRAGVYTSGEAAGARFSTAPGRIEVDGAGTGEVRIELPQSARAASVEINGRRYLTKDGDQLRLTVPAEDSAGAEVTFRVQQ